MDDFSWPVLTLGIEDGGPPAPLEQKIAAAATNGVAGRPERESDSTDRQPDPGGPRHEDHDPTPPGQPAEGGPL
jgi:hypothetical protein